MDWLLLIVEIASIIAVFLLGLFTKNYLPSYIPNRERSGRRWFAS